MGMDIYGKDPRSKTGEYFRASIWTWPTIRQLMVYLNAAEKLNLNLDGFEYNEGHGLKSQEECDRMANALESYINGADELFETKADSTIEFAKRIKTQIERGEVDVENLQDAGIQAYAISSATEKVEDMPTLKEILSGPSQIMISQPDLDFEDQAEMVREWICFLRCCGGFSIL